MADKILAGDYTGIIEFKLKENCMCITYGKKIFNPERKFINKSTVESYEIIEEDGKVSFSSGVIRGVAGAALLGGVGAIAGAASAKKKKKYKVSIVFNDGTRCLCELDKSSFDVLERSLY